MGLLRNFTETINSDNTHDTLDCNNEDEIIIGGSCTHVFALPFSYSSCIKSGKVIYKQGLDVILEIDIDDSMVSERDTMSMSVISVTLRPSQTLLFDDTILDTQCQIRLISKNDKVMYDEPYDINVISPLKVETILED